MQMLFRKSTLQNISHDIGDIAVRMANAGSDRLYVKKRRNHHEFYRYDPVAQKETYISKRDFDTISELEQNAYYRELIPHLQHIAGLMKNEEFDLLKKIPMDVYDNQHPALKTTSGRIMPNVLTKSEHGSEIRAIPAAAARSSSSTSG